MTEAERTSKKGRALAAEILRADQKVQGYNVTGNAKSAATAANKAETAAERAQREQNQIAVQTAERNQKIKEYAESVIKTQREAEFDIRQNEIDLLKDGVEKELKQVELNYDRLVFANQQRRAEMLEGIRDLKELEWENANPTAKKNGLTFDRSSVSDDYLSDANVADLREQGKNAEADRLQGMLDQLKAYSRIATEIRAQGEKEALDKMLGDVLTYEQQRLKITEEYTRKRDALYEKNEDGTFKTEILNTMQTPALFALKNGLVEGEARARMIARLRENFEQHDNCLQTGFLGTSILMATLTENGMADIAYELLFQRKNPSWLYSVDNGATTIWERWNSYMLDKGMGPRGMNSFNHYAYGCVCEWIWETVAGIAADPAVAGFKHIIMKPVPDKRLGHLTAEYNSASGSIKSAWRYEGDKWIWEFTVPEGATATVTLPGESESKVYESGSYTVEK